MKRNEMIEHISRILPLFDELKNVDKQKLDVYAGVILNQCIDYGLRPKDTINTEEGLDIQDHLDMWDWE